MRRPRRNSCLIPVATGCSEGLCCFAVVPDKESKATRVQSSGDLVQGPILSKYDSVRCLLSVATGENVNDCLIIGLKVGKIIESMIWVLRFPKPMSLTLLDKHTA